MIKTKWSRWTAVAPLAAILMGSVVAGCGNGKDDTKIDNPNASNPAVPNGKDDTKLDNPDKSNPMVAPIAKGQEKTGITGNGSSDGQAVGNPITTVKIKSKLLADPTVGATGLNVSTAEGGTVSLTGNVKTAAAKAKAEQVAKSTEGVKKVINNLKVMP